MIERMNREIMDSLRMAAKTANHVGLYARRLDLYVETNAISDRFDYFIERWYRIVSG